MIHFTHCVNYKSLASTFTHSTSSNYKIPNYLLEHKNSTTYSDRVTICVNTQCMCVWLKTTIKDRKERHAYLHVTHKSWTKAATWSIHDTITLVNIVCLTEYRRRFQQLLTCAKVRNKTRAHKSRRNRTSVCCQHRQWHKDGDAGTSARTKGGEANLEARTLFPEKHLSAWQTQTERESFELNLFGWAAQRLILKNPGLATQIWLTRRRRVCNHLNALAAPEVLLRRQRTVLQLLRWWVETKDKNFDFDFWNIGLLDSAFSLLISRWHSETNRSIKLFTEMALGKLLLIEQFRLELFVLFIQKEENKVFEINALLRWARFTFQQKEKSL